MNGLSKLSCREKKIKVCSQRLIELLRLRLSNVSMILRITTILPECEASKVLIDNLNTYAGLLPESSEMSIRDIEIS